MPNTPGPDLRTKEWRDLEAPSAEELSRLDELEEAARSPAARLERPVKAPFPWAEPYFTVGVTGTNGKSSTTHLIAAALRGPRQAVLCESTLGYFLDDVELRVPRTSRGYVAALRHAAEKGCRRAAIEVTSAALVRGFARSWRFDLGVFTNLSRDHVEQHGSWEHYLAAKAQLFVHLGAGRTAIFNASDPAALMIDRVTPGDVERRYFASPSRGQPLAPADLEIRESRVSPAGTRIALVPSPTADALGGELFTRLIGHVFAENAVAAALAALAAGETPEHVRARIAACPVIPGRFEIVARDPLVAIDYAHTPDALARTCLTARELAGRRRIIVVFGAGGGRDVLKREPMGRAVGSGADLAIVTSDNPRDEDPREIAKALARGCRRGGRAHVKVEIDRRRALELGLLEARPGDVVVIAGRGHERGQTVRGVEQPFSDADEVRRILGGPRAQGAAD